MEHVVIFPINLPLMEHVVIFHINLPLLFPNTVYKYIIMPKTLDS
jgi:hypothetical protein